MHCHSTAVAGKARCRLDAVLATRCSHTRPPQPRQSPRPCAGWRRWRAQIEPDQAGHFGDGAAGISGKPENRIAPARRALLARAELPRRPRGEASVRVEGGSTPSRFAADHRAFLASSSSVVSQKAAVVSPSAPARADLGSQGPS